MKYILLILLFASCRTAKELLEAAEKKNPAIVAELARDKYPCTDLLKSDTAVIFKDTTVYIDCPEVTTTYEVVRVDTINNVVTKTVRVPVTMPIRTEYITKWFEDSAKLKILTVEATACHEAAKKLQADKDSLQTKVNRKSKENWIWRVIALALLVWQGVRLWGRMTTIKMKSV